VQLALHLMHNTADLVAFLLCRGRDEETVLGHVCHTCAPDLVEGDVLFPDSSKVFFLLIYSGVVMDRLEDDHPRLIGAAQFLQGVVHHSYPLLEYQYSRSRQHATAGRPRVSGPGSF
jgi:hypothetical protein